MRRRDVEIATDIAGRAPAAEIPWWDRVGQREPETKAIAQVQVPFPTLQLAPGQFAGFAADGDSGRLATVRQIPVGTVLPLLRNRDQNVIVGSAVVLEGPDQLVILKATLEPGIGAARDLAAVLRMGGASLGLSIRTKTPMAASIDTFAVSADARIARVG